MYYFKNKQLQPFDILVSPDHFGIFRHYIIYLGNHDFIHCVPKEGVIKVAPEEIKQRELITVLRPTIQDEAAAMARALGSLGRPYDLIDFNCEGFVNYIITGKPISKQFIDFATTFKQLKSLFNETIQKIDRSRSDSLGNQQNSNRSENPG